LRPDLPLLLGAWGEQTIRACLPYVAEIKLGGTTNPRIVKKIRALLDALAVRQARDPRSIHLVVGAVTVTARNGADARALAKRQAALYLPVIARLDPTLDLAPELLARVTALASRYDFDGAGALISDELLSQIAFAGTPAQVASQAQALFAAGAARVEFGTPHGITDKEGIEILGEQVLPALQ
jgi:5,10-methylenetetrahydromethanopterin reductase